MITERNLGNEERCFYLRQDHHRRLGEHFLLVFLHAYFHSLSFSFNSLRLFNFTSSPSPSPFLLLSRSSLLNNYYLYTMHTHDSSKRRSNTYPLSRQPREIILVIGPPRFTPVRCKSLAMMLRMVYGLCNIVLSDLYGRGKFQERSSYLSYTGIQDSHDYSVLRIS